MKMPARFVFVKRGVGNLRISDLRYSTCDLKSLTSEIIVSKNHRSSCKHPKPVNTSSYGNVEAPEGCPIPLRGQSIG